MIWELVNVAPGPDGRGRTTYKDEHGNQVTLSGDPQGVDGITRLLASESQDTLRARNSITGGELGYAVSFIGPQGPDLLHISLSPPGLAHFGVLLQLRDFIAQRINGPVHIINFWPMPGAPRVERVNGTEIETRRSH